MLTLEAIGLDRVTTEVSVQYTHSTIDEVRRDQFLSNILWHPLSDPELSSTLGSIPHCGTRKRINGNEDWSPH
jgi:hypothetical protein